MKYPLLALSLALLSACGNTNGLNNNTSANGNAGTPGAASAVSPLSTLSPAQLSEFKSWCEMEAGRVETDGSCSVYTSFASVGGMVADGATVTLKTIAGAIVVKKFDVLYMFVEGDLSVYTGNQTSGLRSDLRFTNDPNQAFEARAAGQVRVVAGNNSYDYARYYLSSLRRCYNTDRVQIRCTGQQ